MLMINNHFAWFQLPGKLLKTKKMCSLFPWQHGISYLLLCKKYETLLAKVQNNYDSLVVSGFTLYTHQTRVSDFFRTLYFVKSRKQHVNSTTEVWNLCHVWFHTSYTAKGPLLVSSIWVMKSIESCAWVCGFLFNLSRNFLLPQIDSGIEETYLKSSVVFPSLTLTRLYIVCGTSTAHSKTQFAVGRLVVFAQNGTNRYKLPRITHAPKC
jgi:hypothetical protein